MYQILEYIKFLLKSTNQHGVHSPFVYDLVTKCFYNKTVFDDYKFIRDFRKSLLENDKNIEVTDFGSGSRLFNSNIRSIRAIAKTSGTPIKRAQLLYRIVKYLNPKQTLELGTSLGIATHAMAIGSIKNEIITIEGCPNISEVANQQFKTFKIQNIHQKTGEFNHNLKQVKDHKYDLIFFDGNHSKTATLDYFNTLLDSTHNNSVLIFDDIHWSKGMTEAWELIKEHPKVTVSIDTFFWGFIFFRKEQVKENFTIRL